MTYLIIRPEGTVYMSPLGNKTPHIDKQYGEIKIGRMG